MIHQFKMVSFLNHLEASLLNLISILKVVTVCKNCWHIDIFLAKQFGGNDFG